MPQRKAVLLRGVTPNGRSKIPNMTYLAQILEEAGFGKVKVFLQTGNLILETTLNDEDTRRLIHKTIYEKLDADILPVIKEISQLKKIVEENPFDDSYDQKCVRAVFTNDPIDEKLLKNLLAATPDLVPGSECIYFYAPKNTGKRSFNNNFFERHLRITATVRSLNVIEKLLSI